MTSRKNGRGTATRWASEESISPRCVLDDCTTPTTTSQSTATNTTSTSSAAATTSNTITATYTAPPTPPTPAQAGQQPPPPQQQSWKAVAEAWRSRSRRIPSLRPTMSSALRRLSLRRADQQHDDARDFCVLMPSLRTFSLGELKRATGNFSGANVVGRGGFAKVYRGRLPGGELVAVKRLTAAGGGRDRVEGFLAELGHVVNVSHPNIARLVGVGVDGGEYLVFPFSRLGCLSGLLHGGGGGPGGGGGGRAAETMTWAARHRVAVGTARGLEYLHERCARRIVHRDIKPANILLMDNYEPLICDFGLARWLPAELTHLQVTVFEGTFGYVPPEYTSHGVFSEKTDVFALGVVLLELLTGRRAVDAAKLSLVAWARQFLDNDKDDEAEEEVLKMADPALGGRYDGEQLRDVAWAAKLCVQTSPDHRPRMSQVLRILQGAGSPRRRGSAGQNRPEFQEQHHAMTTNRCDAARHTDDLSRHKALAFDDLDGESSCASLVSPRADVPAGV